MDVLIIIILVIIFFVVFSLTPGPIWIISYVLGIIMTPFTILSEKNRRIAEQKESQRKYDALNQEIINRNRQADEEFQRIVTSFPAGYFGIAVASHFTHNIQIEVPESETLPKRIELTILVQSSNQFQLILPAQYQTNRASFTIEKSSIPIEVGDKYRIQVELGQKLKAQDRSNVVYLTYLTYPVGKKMNNNYAYLRQMYDGPSLMVCEKPDMIVFSATKYY